MKFDGIDGFWWLKVMETKEKHQMLMKKIEFFFKKMRNIILSDLDRFWDFLLKGNGRKRPIYDFIKIGKNRKNLI